MLRTISAGIVIAVVCYFLPELLFSGEAQIHVIVENPAAFGIGMLLLLAFLKLLLLALSFKADSLAARSFPFSRLDHGGPCISLAFPEYRSASLCSALRRRPLLLLSGSADRRSSWCRY